jgi:uncharacterized protein YrzB (UPF0473 family)
MYPDVPILVQRNASKQKKSYFFLQDAREKFEDQGRAFFNTVRTVNIHLVTEGLSAVNPGSDDAYWKTKRVCDYLRDRLLRERVVPQFIFNEPWFPPAPLVKPDGTLTAGTYELACTSVDKYDKESLLGSSTTVTVDGTEKLFLALTDWPRGHPLDKEHVVYLKVGSAWNAIKVVPAIISDQGSTMTEITSLTPLGPTRTPPVSSKQWMGYLKIETATASMVESIQVDDAFHGFVNVTFRSRAPQMFRSYPRINSAAATFAVS